MRRARSDRSAKAEKARTADEGPDAVRCLLCDRTYRAISHTHLRRSHGFDGDHPVEDYKERFGLDIAVCRATQRTMRHQREDYWERHGQRWPRERVIAELRRRAREGKSLASSRLGVALELAVRRRFGTWERAMRRAGLAPEPHRLLKRWDRESLVAAVRELRAAGEPLYGSHVERTHPGLHSAAYRVLGNWGACLRAAGLDPKAHRQPSKWSVEKAREWVLGRQQAGRPISADHAPAGLLGRVRRKTTGGWTAFVASLGVPYPRVVRRRDWSRDEVLTIILDRNRRGLPLNRVAVAADGQAPIHHAVEYFGSWDEALRAAGIDPATVRLSRPWSREDVILAIRKRHADRRPMGYAAAKAEDPRLVKAAQRLFPSSWRRALAAAGIDPSLARRSGAPPRRGRGG